MNSGGHAVRQDSISAITFMLLAIFLLATMDVSIKRLVESYPSIQVVFLRCLFSAPWFAAWILLRNRKLFRPARLRHHLLRALIGIVMLYAVAECFRELPLADAYAIFFAAPLLITVLSGVIMKEPAGTVRLVAAMIGFGGVLVVLKPGASSLLSYGSVMALVAVVSYTFVVLLLRSLGRNEHSMTIAFWYTGLIGLGTAFFAWQAWVDLRWEHWPWFVVLAVSGTLGQLVLTAAFRRASAAVIAPFEYLHMFWAVLYGWWFWGELPTLRTWLGSAVIIACGLYILFRERKLAIGDPAAAPVAPD
ncbi:MAG: DMT family transporter [Xanthomonadales bacterium]|nr:DMT family transporter [Xanthomonadales bacterium]